MVRRNRALESMENAKDHLEGGDNAGAGGETFQDDQTGDRGGDGDGGEAPKKRGRKKTFARTNGFDPAVIGGYCERLHNLHNELEETSGTLRKDIGEIYEEAAKIGVSKKILKLVFGKERADIKREKKIDALESDEKVSLEQMEAALGAFRDTPLGEAAMGRAGA